MTAPIRLLALLGCATLAVAGCGSTSVPAPVSQRTTPAERPRAAAPPVVPATAAPPAAAAPSPAVAPASSARAPAGTPASRPETHRVRKGDTLISIALEYGLDPRELSAWNRIDNPNLIRVGQELRLRPPTGDAASPAPAAAPATAAAAAAPASAPTAPAGAAASRASGTDGVRTEPRALRQPFSEKAMAEATAAARRAPGGSSGGSAPAASAPSTAPPAVSPLPAAAAAEPAPAGRPGEAAEGVAAARTWAWPAAGQVIERFSDVNRGVDIAGRAGQPILASADGRVVYSGAGIRGYGRMLIVKHDDVYVSVYAHASELLVKEGQSVTRGQRIAEMGSTDTDRVKLHFEIRRLGRPVDPLTYLPAPGTGS